MLAKLIIALAVAATASLASPIFTAHDAQPVQAGPSSVTLTCSASTDGPPGGCPSGDCVTACHIVHSAGSSDVEVHLLLADGESVPTQVVLTQDESTVVVESEVPYTISQLVLRDEWVSVDDHATGGPSVTSSTLFTLELVF